MARYEHLPIFRAAFDLSVHIEKIVRNFSRYHKYTLGTELRTRSRAVLERIIRANSADEGRRANAECGMENAEKKRRTKGECGVRNGECGKETKGEGRRTILLELREELEQFKVLARLCHESGGFASTRAYLYVSEQVVGLSKQNEGWLRSGGNRPRKRNRQEESGETAHGRNR